MPGLDGTMILFVLPCVAWMTGVHHHTQLLLVEMESHYIFLGCTQIAILLISASQVARIIGLSYCTGQITLVSKILCYFMRTKCFGMVFAEF
jgi:hypothetical protein